MSLASYQLLHPAMFCGAKVQISEQIAKEKEKNFCLSFSFAISSAKVARQSQVRHIIQNPKFKIITFVLLFLRFLHKKYLFEHF